MTAARYVKSGIGFWTGEYGISRPQVAVLEESGVKYFLSESDELKAFLEIDIHQFSIFFPGKLHFEITYPVEYPLKPPLITCILNTCDHPLYNVGDRIPKCFYEHWSPVYHPPYFVIVRIWIHQFYIRAKPCTRPKHAEQRKLLKLGPEPYFSYKANRPEHEFVYQKVLDYFPEVSIAEPIRPPKKCLPSEPSISFTMKRILDTPFVVSCHPEETVYDLKEKCQHDLGFPPDQQRLIFAGKELKDWQTIAACNIQAGSEIHSLMKLKGCDVHVDWGKYAKLPQWWDDVKFIQNLSRSGPTLQDLNFDDTIIFEIMSFFTHELDREVFGKFGLRDLSNTSQAHK